MQCTSLSIISMKFNFNNIEQFFEKLQNVENGPIYRFLLFPIYIKPRVGDNNYCSVEISKKKKKCIFYLPIFTYN